MDTHILPGQKGACVSIIFGVAASLDPFAFINGCTHHFTDQIPVGLHDLSERFAWQLTSNFGAKRTGRNPHQAVIHLPQPLYLENERLQETRDWSFTVHLAQRELERSTGARPGGTLPNRAGTQTPEAAEVGRPRSVLHQGTTALV